MARRKRFVVAGRCRQVETQGRSASSSEASRIPDSARASSSEADSGLEGQTSLPNSCATQAAAKQVAPQKEQAAAATRAQRNNRRNLPFLTFSCTAAAFSAFRIVLLSAIILLFQNQSLRTSLQDNAHLIPVLQSVAKLNLAARLESVLPQQSSLDLDLLGHRLGTILTNLPMSMSDILVGQQLPRPALELRKQGLTAKHPVFIMPGFVTSGLELWETMPCAAGQRRKRVWGSLDMARSFLLNKNCWLDHLRLDEVSGLDPQGVKVRPSQGLGAIEYFVAGYYVWARLIEAFADLGYDATNMVTEPYDWRLSLPNLEKRDALYSKIKASIEALVNTHGEKVMVVAHSWGDTVFRSFMAWVSARSPLWVDQNLAVYANVAGPTLGVPKAISSFLSGESRDTVEMGYLASQLTDRHFPRSERTRLLRSWGGGMGMLPIGGTAFWGNTTWAPDDPRQLRRKNVSYGSIITSWGSSFEKGIGANHQQTKLLDTFKPNSEASHMLTTPRKKLLDLEASLRLVMNENGPLFESNAKKWSAIETRDKCAAHLDGDDFHFSPLTCPLPNAPSLQMFCMYGVGNPTERAYHYRTSRSDRAFEAATERGSKGLDSSQLDVRNKIHTVVNDASLQTKSGILLSDGDGTVPLLSLGGLCQKHWQEPHLNPSGFRVVTREYQHDPSAPSQNTPPSIMAAQISKLSTLLRGGVRSAEHVDILSHEDVIMDLLLMASGRATNVQQQIHSRIHVIAAQLR